MTSTPATAPAATTGKSPHGLTAEVCWRLLGSATVGRIAMQTAEGLVVLPVNYAVDGGRIFFRTSVDGLLGSAAGWGREVAFQADSIDHEAERAWTVLVRGQLRQATRDQVPEDRMRTWVAIADPVLAMIVPDEVSGRLLAS